MEKENGEMGMKPVCSVWAGRCWVGFWVCPSLAFAVPFHIPNQLHEGRMNRDIFCLGHFNPPMPFNPICTMGPHTASS